MSRSAPRPVTPGLLARRRLESFLYIILRDSVTPGRVEDVMKNHVSTLVNVYSNRFLAGYAESLADRLLMGAKKPRPKRGR